MPVILSNQDNEEDFVIRVVGDKVFLPVLLESQDLDCYF